MKPKKIIINTLGTGLALSTAGVIGTGATYGIYSQNEKDLKCNQQHDLKNLTCCVYRYSILIPKYSTVSTSTECQSTKPLGRSRGGGGKEKREEILQGDKWAYDEVNCNQKCNHFEKIQKGSSIGLISFGAILGVSIAGIAIMHKKDKVNPKIIA